MTKNPETVKIKSNTASNKLHHDFQFLADHCNATFNYCHEMSSVCRL